METLKVVGAWAGAVGIIVALVLTLFREIVRKKIFPQLTKAQAFRILFTIIVFSFLIGCLGIYAWWIKDESPGPATPRKLTIYLDSIPWRVVFVEIPEKEFAAYTNAAGEIAIPLESNADRSIKILVDGRYASEEVFDGDDQEKSIYLQSPRFKQSEIAGVVVNSGKPERDVKIITEHGDSTRTNELGQFRLRVKSRVDQDRINILYSKGDRSRSAVVQVDQLSLTLDL